MKKIIIKSSYGATLAISVVAALSTFAIASVEAPLTFDRALSQILSRSTAIAVQRTNLEAAHLSTLPAKLNFVPSLSFDAGENWIGRSGYTTSNSQIEATSQLNLFHWGADVAGLHAAQFDEAIQRNILDTTWLQVEDTAVAALLQVIEVRKEVEISTDIVKMQRQLLDVANRRYQGGYLPFQEIEKLYIDVENAQATLVNSQLREVNARTSLDSLLGHSELIIEWPWKDRLKEVDAQALMNESLDLSQRPDWKSAHARIEAEEERYQRNIRLLLPSLDSSLSYGNYRASALDFKLPGSGTPAWKAGLSISFPFFDHLVSYTNAKVQAQVRSGAEISLTQVERQAKAEYDSAKNSFGSFLSTAVIREHTLALSKKLFQDSFKRFQTGRIPVNDLALDQNRLFSSESLEIQGWSSAHLGFTRLCHSRGKRLSDCQ